MFGRELTPAAFIAIFPLALALCVSSLENSFPNTPSCLL